jgi:MFS family permease
MLLYTGRTLTVSDIEKNLRHNFIFNLLDGAFFGLAFGLASFVTIIPLFVSTLTDSAIIIGLVPAMHTVGWYLPQLFTANRVSRQSRYKSMVMRYTINERVPFVGLALVAWFSTRLDNNLALVLIFGLLIWQGLGGGFCANPWQNMIGKVIPDRMHGLFFGAQSGSANILMTAGALITGMILERLPTPDNYALTFLLASLALLLAYGVFALIREPHHHAEQFARDRGDFRHQLVTILKGDANFRKFLVVRSLIQLGIMAIGFYTVYSVKQFTAPGSAIGIMTAVMSITKVFANLILGRIGDSKGHRFSLQLGGIALSLSALVAWRAPTYQWFYLAFILAGIAYVTAWTTPMAMTLQFGDYKQRPAYIGLSNTVTAPSALLAPVLGGWLADSAGYTATFLVALIAGILIIGVLQSMAGWKPKDRIAPSQTQV